MSMEASAVGLVLRVAFYAAQILYITVRTIAVKLHMWPAFVTWIIWAIATNALDAPEGISTTIAVIITIVNAIYAIWHGVTYVKAMRNAAKGGEEETDYSFGEMIRQLYPQRETVIEEDIEDIEPAVPESNHASPAFCRHCGSPLRPGSNFCAKCGEQIR